MLDTCLGRRDGETEYVVGILLVEEKDIDHIPIYSRSLGVINLHQIS